MLTVLRALVRKGGWLLVSFVVIVAVLATVNELPAKLRGWREQADAARTVAAELNAIRPKFERSAHAAVGKADFEIAALRRAGEAELAVAEREIALRRKKAQARADSGITLNAGKIADSYRARYVELPLLDRAAMLIASRRSNLRRIAMRRMQDRSLERAFDRHDAKVAAFNARAGELASWQRQASGQSRSPLCRRAPRIPGCGLIRSIGKRTAELRRDRLTLRNEADALRAQRRAMRALTLGGEQVADGAEIAADAAAEFGALAKRKAVEANGYTWNNAKSALRRYGRTALLILSGAVFLPILYKLFAFFVIARLAPRARSVRLLGGGPPLVASASGISVDVAIDRDVELLLRSGLQSSAADIRGSDEYVLDWRFPLTCVAAGLVNLQRLRSDRPEHVIVTGTDESHRVAAITVPTGGAVVLHPRALLGVVKPRGERLVITRPWRVFRLVSWVTAQFRYVVFHGPCTLIIQGRNGVMAEDASRGRMIGKRLTLGFDAGVAYGASRTASFLPYLRGQASLFNDRFDGIGRYLYQQRADGTGKGGLWGRGLKGLSDAALSAFGI